jgi:hypothetical protein
MLCRAPQAKSAIMSSRDQHTGVGIQASINHGSARGIRVRIMGRDGYDTFTFRAPQVDIVSRDGRNNSTVSAYRDLSYLPILMWQLAKRGTSLAIPNPHGTVAEGGRS